ncbi:uncharacterized protein [Macaca nemestrina]|uniref:uncharacterized protein isoform X1 n=1 Tax=Macaca nemestrina TaxID=9545 RepID=UPI0039B8E93C
MSWDSAGPKAETSSQQVECSLACLEQERHQRQGSQGQAEWRRPDQDIEDKILLLQTEVEKAQWRLDQMTHSLLAQSPARGHPKRCWCQACRSKSRAGMEAGPRSFGTQTESPCQQLRPLPRLRTQSICRNSY